MLRRRELKVWNDTLKMMLDISDVEEYYNLKNQKRSVYHDHSKDKLIFLRNTWVKDKYGRSIYDGDILKCKLSDDKYENYLVVWDEDECCFDAVNLDKSNFISPSIWHEQEIVGNIYQNSMLEV